LLKFGHKKLNPNYAKKLMKNRYKDDNFEYVSKNISKQPRDNTLSHQQKWGKLSEIKLYLTLVSKIEENTLNGKYELNYKRYGQNLKKEIKYFK